MKNGLTLPLLAWCALLLLLPARLPAAQANGQQQAAVPQAPAPPPGPPASYHTLYEFQPPPSPPAAATILSALSREAAGKVFLLLRQQKETGKRIAVLSAVPLADFKRETEFGRLWGEYLLTDLADRGLRVKELRLGREITILPQTGEFVLTRNPGELAVAEPAVDYVVVSTYGNTASTLILQGRLVDLQSGETKTSWRHTVPLSNELLALFRQAPATPHTIPIKAMP